MKNFILLFAMILGMAVYSSNSEIAPSILEGDTACVSYTTSCGVVGMVCGETFEDLEIAGDDLEEWQC